MLQRRRQPATVRSCLAHRRRRLLLSHLKDREGSQPLADLAEYVAGRASDSTPSDGDSTAVEVIYATLYHAHVPKLEDAGFVQYVRASDTVSLVENPETVPDERYP